MKNKHWMIKFTVPNEVRPHNSKAPLSCCVKLRPLPVTWGMTGCFCEPSSELFRALACFRWTSGVRRLSRGLWDIIKPMPVHQIAGESSGLLISPVIKETFNVSCVSLDSPTPCALKIAEKISEQFENAVLLMVRRINIFIWDNPRGDLSHFNLNVI